MKEWGDSMLNPLHSEGIEHYYGDTVRQLLVAAAAVLLVAIPILGAILPFGVLPQVAGALLLVLRAGLTNPHGRWVLVYDALISGFSALALEMTAVSLYSTDSIALFFVREVATLLLIFAFYYSVKTVRAMSLGRIDKGNMPLALEDAQEGAYKDE